jgi:predicted Fe-Mo cluster-binding NifX family protein
MKIIITASSASLDAGFDQRFGRSEFFVVVDTETMQYEAFPNPGINASGGAGTQAAQFAAEKNVGAVISGNFGPNAAYVLRASGIPMFTNKKDGNIMNVIEQFIAGELQQVDSPNPRYPHRL